MEPVNEQSTHEAVRLGAAVYHIQD